MKLPLSTRKSSSNRTTTETPAPPIVISSKTSAATSAKAKTSLDFASITGQLSKIFNLPQSDKEAIGNKNNNKLYMIFPKPTALLDEEKRLPAVSEVTRSYLKHQEMTTYVVKRLIPNQSQIVGASGDEITYVTYMDKEPAVDYKVVSDHKILPEKVVRDLGRCLVVEDQIIYERLVSMAGGPEKVAELGERRISRKKKKHKDKDNQEKDLILREGQFFAASIYVINPPSLLAPTVMSDPKLDFDVFTVKVKYEEPNEGMLNMLEQTLGYEAQFSERARIELAKLRDLRRALAEGLTHLHKTAMVYTVFDLTKKGVDNKVRNIVTTLSQNNVRAHRTPDVQERLLYQRMPLPSYVMCAIVPTSTLNIAYPTPADILENGGVNIGYNKITGRGRTPVILNIKTTPGNQHIVVFGLPGGGKTHLILMLLDEWNELCQQIFAVTGNPDDIPLYMGIDPTANRQYKKLAEVLGIPYLELEEGLGFKDITTRYESPKITSMVAKLFSIRKTEENILLRAVNALKDDGKDILHLEQYVDSVIGPMVQTHEVTQEQYSTIKHHVYAGLQKYRYIFEGHLPADSFIVHINTQDRQANRAAMGFTLMTANERAQQNTRRQKIVIVEEAYQAIETEASEAGYRIFSDETAVEELKVLARGGRTLNVCLIFITQRPSDITGDDGIAIAKEAATMFIFQTNDTDAVAKMTDLQRKEIAEIKHGSGQLQKGKCVMIRGGHYLLQIRSTPELLKKYNTDPTRKY